MMLVAEAEEKMLVVGCALWK